MKSMFFIKPIADISKETEAIRAKSKRQSFAGQVLVWRGYFVKPSMEEPVEGTVVCFSKDRSALKAASFGRMYAKNICPDACTVKQLFPKGALIRSFYAEIETNARAAYWANMWKKATRAVEAEVAASFVRIENGKLAVFGSIESDSSAKRITWYENLLDVCNMLDIQKPTIF